MQETKKKIRTRKGLREYSYLGCPLTRNRSAWCFRLCTPDSQGHGHCGRVAPHSLKSAIQTAIEKHGKKKMEQRLRGLEKEYLDGPGKALRGVGIRLAEGEADVVLPGAKTNIDVGGGVLDAVSFKLMSDSAVQAVSTLFDEVTVLTSEFSFTLTHTKPKGVLVARGRYVGQAGKHFLADTMLTDSEGTELGRGEGVFFELATTDESGSQGTTGEKKDG